MIYVGIENTDNKQEVCMSELPQSQLEHIYKNKGKLAHVRTTAAFILHRLIKAHAPEMIPYEIAYTELGRPYIVGAKNIDISVSYAGDYAAVALFVGDGSRVGIDIEQIKKSNTGLAKKYFTEEENIRLSSLSKKESADEFSKLWTRYESKAKYLGGGLADMRKAADVYIYTTVFDGDFGGTYALSVCTYKEESIDIKEF